MQYLTWDKWIDCWTKEMFNAILNTLFWTVWGIPTYYSLRLIGFQHKHSLSIMRRNFDIWHSIRSHHYFWHSIRLIFEIWHRDHEFLQSRGFSPFSIISFTFLFLNPYFTCDWTHLPLDLSISSSCVVRLSPDVLLSLVSPLARTGRRPCCRRSPSIVGVGAPAAAVLH